MVIVLFIRRSAALLLLAAFAFAIVVTRARTQSITIDEADSYNTFAAGPPEAVFLPSAGNHLLNTILERFVTGQFGLTEFTVRVPALMGALLYLISTLYLCWLLIEGRALQVLVYACLVFNPFVLDYLVAARGYALAIGCLLVALAAICTVVVRDLKSRNLDLVCAAASTFAALSIGANFSFGIVCVVSVASLLILERRLVATTLPGLLVGALLYGNVILHWPKGALVYGSTSFAATWNGLVLASFFRLPELIAQRYPWLVSIQTKQVLAAAAVAIGIITAVAAWLRRGSLNGRQSRRLAVAGFLGFVLAGTALLHFTAFKVAGVLLPRDRTALYAVPLSVLLLGILISIQEPWLARLGMGVLGLHAIYFLGCLRLGYFQEWRFNSDTRAIYRKLEALAPVCQTRDAVIEWRYAGALNFYRSAFGESQYNEFQAAYRISQFPSDAKVYVLYGPDAGEFIRKLHLDMVYSNPETLAEIAIRGCQDRQKVSQSTNFLQTMPQMLSWKEIPPK